MVEPIRGTTKKLKPSLLQLDGFWIEALSLKANPQASSERTKGLLPLVYEVAYAFPSQGTGAERMVRLRVRTRRTPPERPYDIDMSIVGRFSLSKPIKDDALVDRLFQSNAPGILYGIMRGIIAALTALGRSGRLELPSANFLANGRRP
jgi:preprotein translocase subunit SecB